MRLTTKGRYAVTAMLDLALHNQNGPVPLADVALRQGISLSYLEQLFSKLRKRMLVKSIRGPGGGYELEKETSEISIATIIDAVDESIDSTRCRDKGDCQEGEKCLTHHLWLDLSHEIHTFLNNVTLESLMLKREVQVTASRQNKVSNIISSQLLDI
ncbi:MAG: Rrf2 family iron-sulfur cluster assembly transcriptional regulator [Pseudohongiellaceae bacterium]|jgi:Rrf2 family iron-sulfur cluster assembly transcriptional regulator